MTTGRIGKLKIALLAIPLCISGTMTMTPVHVHRPVLDSEGNPVVRADGSRIMEIDHWGNFKVNWIGYSLVYAGIGTFAFGVSGWLIKGFADRSKATAPECE